MPKDDDNELTQWQTISVKFMTANMKGSRNASIVACAARIAVYYGAT